MARSSAPDTPRLALEFVFFDRRVLASELVFRL
jgi:hypothetical protein